MTISIFKNINLLISKTKPTKGLVQGEKNSIKILHSL